MNADYSVIRQSSITVSLHSTNFRYSVSLAVIKFALSVASSTHSDLRASTDLRFAIGWPFFFECHPCLFFKSLSACLVLLLWCSFHFILMINAAFHPVWCGFPGISLKTLSLFLSPSPCFYLFLSHYFSVTVTISISVSPFLSLFLSCRSSSRRCFQPSVFHSWTWNQFVGERGILIWSTHHHRHDHHRCVTYRSHNANQSGSAENHTSNRGNTSDQSFLVVRCRLREFGCDVFRRHSEAVGILLTSLVHLCFAEDDLITLVRRCPSVRPQSNSGKPCAIRLIHPAKSSIWHKFRRP